MHGTSTDDRHIRAASAVVSWARTWGAPRRWLTALLAAMVLTAAGLAAAPPAGACGGFFCVNTPVDQNAERIIFTQNGDGTVSAYVQIEYTGSAPDFSWILPLPEAIDAEAVEVPEDAMEAFRELERVTDPNIIPPPLPPGCVIQLAPIMEPAVGSRSGGVRQRRGGAVRVRRSGVGRPGRLDYLAAGEQLSGDRAYGAVDRPVRRGTVRVSSNEVAPRRGGSGRGAGEGDLSLHSADDSAAAHGGCGKSEHGGDGLDLRRPPGDAGELRQDRDRGIEESDRFDNWGGNNYRAAHGPSEPTRTAGGPLSPNTPVRHAN